MEPVTTYRLDRGETEFFGGVTVEMLVWYVGAGLMIWWFDRAFIGNQLIQLAFPVVVLVPVHFVVKAIREMPWSNLALSALRFGALTADRYRVSHDPNPLPFLIPSSHRPVVARGQRRFEPRREEVTA